MEYCLTLSILYRFLLLNHFKALQEALDRHGRPDIFNTDQGAQFTSEAFTGKLKDNGIKISMDGKGRWVDNVIVEQLWCSLKYEEVYLEAYQTPKQTEKLDNISNFIMKGC